MVATFLFGAIDIDDRQTYSLYEQGANGSIAGANVQLVAVDDAPALIEGALPGQRIVCLRFEDEDALQAWYNSDAYQAAMKHRLSSAKTNFLIAVKGMPGA